MEQETKYVLPAEIEQESMRIIGRELAQQGITLPLETEAVVKRVIHTTADFDYAESLRFTPDAVPKALEALRSGRAVITDTNMAKAGISKSALAQLACEARCFMADHEVAEAAKARGTTRATAAIEKAAREYPEAVFAVGNAPTALLALCERIQSGLRPALVIAVPVGFVNVVESKQRIFQLCLDAGIPCIAAMGRKGGSNVAASICNALMYTSLGTLDPLRR